MLKHLIPILQTKLHHLRTTFYTPQPHLSRNLQFHDPGARPTYRTTPTQIGIPDNRWWANDLDAKGRNPRPLRDGVATFYISRG